jgi:hypothetical protein
MHMTQRIHDMPTPEPASVPTAGILSAGALAPEFTLNATPTETMSLGLIRLERDIDLAEARLARDG